MILGDDHSAEIAWNTDSTAVLFTEMVCMLEKIFSFLDYTFALVCTYLQNSSVKELYVCLRLSSLHDIWTSCPNTITEWIFCSCICCVLPANGTSSPKSDSFMQQLLLAIRLSASLLPSSAVHFSSCFSEGSYFYGLKKGVVVLMGF